MVTKEKKVFINLKVFRYDPVVDEKPHYETYKVPYEECKDSRKIGGDTNLDIYAYVEDALYYINRSMGGSIAFRSTFPVLVNGAPAPVHERAAIISTDGKSLPFLPGAMDQDGVITIEPLPFLPVIKDLVVDLEKLYKIRDKLRFFHQPLRPYPGKEWSPQIIPNYREEYMPAQVNACLGVQCGACLAVCPVVDAAWDEFVGPSFFTKLVKYMIHPEDRGDRERTAVLEGLWNCPMCGKCGEACPYDIEVPKMVLEKMKRRVLEKGFDLIPGHKEFTKLVSETGSAVPRGDKPLLEQLPDVVDVKNPKKEVALFIGCVINNNLQKVGQAIINILKKNNIRVHIPKSQECCGSHLFRTGQPGIGSNFVRRNTAILEGLGVDTVITLCPEGGKTLKQDYPEVLGRDPEFKVMDITEFLANEIELDTEKMKELKMTVTFSDPCYLKTWQGIYKEPREILKKIPGLKLVEMEKSDACCGAGGGMWFGRKDLSNKIALKKCEYIKESGAQAVVTTCPYCQLNIEEGLNQIPEKERPKILNIVEILDKAYK